MIALFFRYVDIIICIRVSQHLHFLKEGEIVRATRNREIRQLLQDRRIFAYELAEALNVSTPTLYVRLRQDPLPDKTRDEILSAIDELSRR